MKNLKKYIDDSEYVNIIRVWIEIRECEVKKLASAYNDTVRVFKAFCDENRLRILEMLRTGEKCACKLLDDLRITQSTLSHHMKILCDAGVVQGRKEGKWVYYSISPEGADCARRLLEQQLSLEASGGENGCFCNR